MENISGIQNSYNNKQPSEIQKRMDSQEEFTAIDKEKLKEDSVELANKTKENAEENWLYRKLRALNIEDPKKFLKSILYTALTVVGVAALGNKLSSPTAKLGEKVDDVLLSDKNILGNIYSSVSKLLKKGKDGLSKIPKTKGMKEIQQTVQERPAKMKSKMGRGYERGPVGIFIFTVNDSLEKLTASNKDLFKKILGKDGAEEFLKEFSKGDTCIYRQNPQKYYAELTDKITSYMKKQYPNQLGGKTKMEILDLMKQNKIDGCDLSDFTQINMQGDKNGLKSFFKGGFMSDWWPVNIINNIGTKIGRVVKGDKNYQMNFCRGNLFDSLIKFNAVNGTGAKTMPGRFVQKVITIPTECISNFVNDKSGFGVFLAGTIMSTYDNMQDAPKERKIPTLCNEFTSQTLNWMISMPVAYKILYTSIASMKNLEGTTILTKALKQAGRFFGMGLDYYKNENGSWKHVVNTNKATGFIGGAIRFAAMMFVISPFISKQISKVTNKIFGKPYNKAEEEQKKQQEEELKQVIPELGITQGELIQKMQNNPEAVYKIQQDPYIAAEIEKNPKVLLDLLDGKEIKPSQSSSDTTANSSNFSNQIISSANRDLINKRNSEAGANNQTRQINPWGEQTKNDRSDTAAINEEEDDKSKKTAKQRDTVKYIPSSEPAPVPQSNLSSEQSNQFNKLMEEADKKLQAAENCLYNT